MSKRDMRAKKLLLTVLLAVSVPGYYAPPAWSAGGGQASADQAAVLAAESNLTVGQTETAPAGDEQAANEQAEPEQEKEETAKADPAVANEKTEAVSVTAPSAVTYKARANSISSEDYGVMPLAITTIGDVTADGDSYRGKLHIGSSGIGDYGTAFGVSSEANEYGVSVGYKARAKETGCIAIGAMATVGRDFYVNDRYSTAIGSYSYAMGEKSVAIGSYSTVTANNQVSFGHKIGDEYYKDNGSSLLLSKHNDDLFRDLINVGGIEMHGGLTGVTKVNDIVFSGSTISSVTKVNDIAFSGSTISNLTKVNGITVSARSDGSGFAIGNTSNFVTANSIAVGVGAKAYGNTDAVAVGYNAKAYGQNTSAFGSGAAASGQGGSAFGKGASVTAFDGSAFGRAANATAMSATAIGTASKAYHQNSVAIGSGSQTTAGNQVSFSGIMTDSTTGEIKYLGTRNLVGINNLDMEGLLTAKQGVTDGTATLKDGALSSVSKVNDIAFSGSTISSVTSINGIAIDTSRNLTNVGTYNGVTIGDSKVNGVTLSNGNVNGVAIGTSGSDIMVGTINLTDLANNSGSASDVSELKQKTTKISYDTATGTAIDGVTINQGAVTGVTGINGIGIDSNRNLTNAGTYNGVEIKTTDGKAVINGVKLEKGTDSHYTVGDVDVSALKTAATAMTYDAGDTTRPAMTIFASGVTADSFTVEGTGFGFSSIGALTVASINDVTIAKGINGVGSDIIIDTINLSELKEGSGITSANTAGIIRDRDAATTTIETSTSINKDGLSTNKITVSNDLVVGDASSFTHTKITSNAIIFGEGADKQVTIDASGIHIGKPATGTSTFADGGGTHLDHNSLITGSVTAAKINGLTIGTNGTDIMVGDINLSQLKSASSDTNKNTEGVKRSDADGDGDNDTTTIETATSFTKDGMKTADLEAATAKIGGVQFGGSGAISGINSINGVAVSGSVETGLTIGGVNFKNGLVDGVNVSWLDKRVDALEKNGTGGGGGGGLNTSGIGKPYPDTTTIENNTSINGDGITTKNLEATEGIIVAKGDADQTVINKDGVTVGLDGSQSFINGTDGFISQKGLYIGVNSNGELGSAKFSIDSSSGALTSNVGGHKFTNSSNGAVFSKDGDSAYGSGTQLNTTITGNKVTTGQVNADELWVGGNKVTVAGNGTVEKTEAIDNQLSGIKDGYNYKNGFTTSVADGTTQTASKESTDGKDKWQTSNKTWAEGTTLTTTNTSIDGSENTTVKGSELTTGAGGMSLTTSSKVTDKDGKVTQNTSGKTTMTGDSISVSQTMVTTEKDADGNDKEVTKTSGTTISSGEVTLRREDGSTIEVGSAIEGLQSDVRDLNGRIDRVGVEVEEVGALSSALAGLHPQPQNANTRADFAMAIGSYEGRQALAVGGFYRPDKRTMLSIGASTTSSKHMMNMGISIALDRLPEEERKAQEAAAADPETLNKVLERLAALEQDNQRLQADNKKRDIAYEKLAADYTQLKEKYTEKTAEKQQSETKMEEADSSSEE